MLVALTLILSNKMQYEKRILIKLILLMQIMNFFNTKKLIWFIKLRRKFQGENNLQYLIFENKINTPKFFSQIWREDRETESETDRPTGHIPEVVSPVFKMDYLNTRNDCPPNISFSTL